MSPRLHPVFVATLGALLAASGCSRGDSPKYRAQARRVAQQGAPAAGGQASTCKDGEPCPPGQQAPATQPAPAARPAPAAAKAAPSPSAKPVAAPTPSTKPAAAPTPSARPAAAPRKPPVARSASAPTEAANMRDRMKELEGKPGATEPLEQHLVTPKHVNKDFPGKPGPIPAAGPDDAPVKVFVFSDYQCPVCRRVVEPVKQVVRANPGKVQVLFVNNSLEMHRNAAAAAAAGLAAARQGKFWEFHDKLFQDQRRLQRPDFLEHARALGMDVAKFDKDLDDPAIKAQVDYERELASKLGARGTPAFFVNGRKLVGWGSYGGFAAMVQRALEEAERAPGKGAEVAIGATKTNGEDGALFAKLFWGR